MHLSHLVVLDEGITYDMGWCTPDWKDVTLEKINRALE